jgi:DNA-binding PadR family transcriptional regulator
MGLAPLSEFERAVLMAVLRLENSYGVTIQRELESRLEQPVKFGSIYNALARLAEKGFVSFRMGDPTPERGGRAKRFVHIEAPGLDALNRTREVAEAIWALQPTDG